MDMDVYLCARACVTRLSRKSRLFQASSMIFYSKNICSVLCYMCCSLKLTNFFNLLGTLAAKYEKLGGEVKWMGKPDKVMTAFFLFATLLLMCPLGIFG